MRTPVGTMSYLSEVATESGTTTRSKETPTIMAGDITKLPKWAQEHITRVERSVQWWKSRATVGPEGSNTFLNQGDGEQRPLGSSPVVQFHVGPGRWDYIEAYIQDDGTLYVRGGDSIAVRPQAGNVVHVFLSRR